MLCNWLQIYYKTLLKPTVIFLYYAILQNKMA